jgi:hypothetical protein
VTTDEADRLELLTEATLRPSADPQYALRLAEELEASGRPADAVAAYGQALARLPALIIDADVEAADAGTLAQATLETVNQLGPLSRLDADRIAADFALAGITPDAELPAAWQVVRALQLGDLATAEEALQRAINGERWTASTWLAAEAVARYSCDAQDLVRIPTLLNLLPGSRSTPYLPGIVRVYDQPYREEGLGDYQPVEPVIPAPLMEWPGAYLDLPADC